MITPRGTTLTRVRDLRSFRHAIVESVGRTASPCAVVVPNQASAVQLARRLRDPGVRFVTRDGLYHELHARLADPPRRLSDADREALARAAVREAGRTSLDREGDEGAAPDGARPGYVVALLRFYDQLRRQRQQVARFESLLEEALEREAEFDRGAERMLRQTRLLAAAFRSYERRADASGACDEHMLRDRLIAEASRAPVRAAVVTVGDWIAEPGGLYPADFDLLTRVGGLETLNVIATEGVLASGFHQRIHDWLPGLEEKAVAAPQAPRARLQAPAATPQRWWFTERDREEEVIGIAGRAGGSLSRAALVYKRPLPYLYLAREVLGSAAIRYHTSDGWPLAAEPFCAALDLVLDVVGSSFTRAALIALLRSPHFAWPEAGAPLARESVSALDRALSDARYLGDPDHLTRLAAEWTRFRGIGDAAVPALRAAVAAAGQLAPMATPAPISAQLERVRAFLDAHRPADADAGSDSRADRARIVVAGILDRLAAASRAHDDPAIEVSALTGLVRRSIEDETFAWPPEADVEGLCLLDDQAARYGDFDAITIVGLIDGEWPERPPRNIFYSFSLLKALGWPSERDWRAAAEARFLDLVESPAGEVTLSTITLDDDALVTMSPLVDEVPALGLSTVAIDARSTVRRFPDEALSLEPFALDALDDGARHWANTRIGRSGRDDPAFHGRAGAPRSRPWSVSALETYLDCPFKFFAQRVLKLEEEPDDEEVMDAKQEGRFVHDVFEKFFAAWQAAGHRAVTPDNLDDARTVFTAVVEHCLRDLPQTEAALERTRLLGSSAAAGLGEAVLRMEAERPAGVVGRLLEHKLEGEFAFQTAEGERVIRLNGKADRIDLLTDGTFRVIDYKLGWPPHRARALQLAVYSLCAQQQFAREGREMAFAEAAYLAFKGPKRVVPLFGPGDRDRVLREAQQRLVDAIDAIDRGEFPPRPHDVYRCETCTYAAVCRKDYVGDV